MSECIDFTLGEELRGVDRKFGAVTVLACGKQACERTLVYADLNAR